MPTFSKYETKRVVIDATEPWDGTTPDATPIIAAILILGGTARFVGEGEGHPMRYKQEFTSESVNPTVRHDAPAFLVIDTLEGPHRMDKNDRVIMGTSGEFYPVKPDPFAAKYVPATIGLPETVGSVVSAQFHVPGPEGVGFGKINETLVRIFWHSDILGDATERLCWENVHNPGDRYTNQEVENAGGGYTVHFVMPAGTLPATITEESTN